MPSAARANSPFWDFSLAFYARPGVAEECLALQERHDADVNVVLYLLFLARHGRLLEERDVARLQALAEPWRQTVVLPLRALRRALKAPVGVFEPQATASLRNEVKRIELAAERLQQETLERLAAAGALGRACSDPALCASTHLALYAERIGAPPAGPIARLLELFRAFQGAA
jgi:uncharacterized protein (TIGR02444 family)